MKAQTTSLTRVFNGSFLTFILSFVVMGPAFAFNVGSYEKMVTVSSTGSTVEKSQYESYALLPVLYLRTPENGFVFRTLRWNAPSGLTYEDHIGRDNQRDVWTSPANWNSIVEKGTWTVNSTYFYTELPSRVGRSVYTFQVNPEPASVILSVLGFLILASHFFLVRNRRRGTLAN